MNTEYEEGYAQAMLDYQDNNPYTPEGSDDYVRGYLNGWTDAIIGDKQIDVSTPMDVLNNLGSRLHGSDKD